MYNKIVKTKDQLYELTKTLCSTPVFSFDTETSGLNWWRDKLFIISFSNGHTNWVVPTNLFSNTYLYDFLFKVFSDSTKAVIGHNIKFDMHFIKACFGVEVRRKINDTKVMAHLINENRKTHLKELMRYELTIKTNEEAALLDWLKDNFKRKSEYDYSKVPLEIIAPYAAMDAYGTYKLWEVYEPIVSHHYKNLYETEMKIIQILFRMEINGIKIDVPYFQYLYTRYQEYIEEILTTVKEKVNLDSPQQLGKYFEKTLGIPIPERTAKKNEPKVSSEVLRQINHPFANLVLNYRTLRKLVSTYILPFLDYVDGDIIHGSYNIVGTETGRFSCSRPNLQNLPKNNDIRKGIICEENKEMWFWDQSQIEMVGFAHYSRDPGLVEAFSRGSDIYTSTASQTLNVPLSSITKSQRQVFKAMNLAMIYGVGEKKLSNYMNLHLDQKISRQEAIAFRSQYLETFPGIRQFMRKVMNTVKQDRSPFGHYVRNSFGRVRRIDPEKAYTAVNHLIQGWAADLMKYTMVKIDEDLKPEWKHQIHDALRIDIPINMKDKADYIQCISKHLTDSVKLAVPIRVSVEHSNTNWAEVKSWNT